MLKNALYLRKSRRTYIDEPIKAEDKVIINKLLRLVNKIDGVCIEAVFDDESKAVSAFASYGIFRNVKNFLILSVKDIGDFEQLEKLGYIGEALSLRLVNMGYGTCWVGGAYDRRLVNKVKKTGYVINSLIVFGNVDEKETTRERIFRSIVVGKTKVEKYILNTTYDALDDDYKTILDAILIAPSAINKKPIYIEYDEKTNEIAMSTKELTKYSKLEIGICKANAEIACDKYVFPLGNQKKPLLKEHFIFNSSDIEKINKYKNNEFNILSKIVVCDDEKRLLSLSNCAYDVVKYMIINKLEDYEYVKVDNIESFNKELTLMTKK